MPSQVNTTPISATTPTIQFPKIKHPRLVFFDIETAPTRGWVWRNYEDNLIATDHDWYILSFVAKFSDGRIVTRKLPDYPGYASNMECDKALVADLHDVFNAADIIVAHNGRKFDIRKSNARMIIHGMSPPATYKIVDTLEVAKRYFSFGSNKLTDLGRYLGVGTKVETGGSALWFACMAGDPKAWRRMMRYNKVDVLLLEKVYYRLRPWMVNHPNMNLYNWRRGLSDMPKPERAASRQSGEAQFGPATVSVPGLRELVCQYYQSHAAGFVRGGII